MVKTILRSELIKFFSYSWCFWGVLGTIFVAPLILFFSGTGNVQTLTTSDLLVASLRNLFLSQAGLAIVAASFFGQEYSHAYLRTSLLAIPARMKLALSKMILLVLIVFGVGLISSLMCLGISLIQYKAILTFSIVSKFMIKVGIGMLSWLLITWLTAALTIVTKSQIIPMAVMFPLILGLSQMLLLMTKFAKYLPDLATMNLFLSGNAKIFLTGYQGLGIQLIWTVCFFILALGLFQYRDVR
jgi:hypothetical protein